MNVIVCNYGEFKVISFQLLLQAIEEPEESSFELTQGHIRMGIQNCMLNNSLK